MHEHDRRVLAQLRRWEPRVEAAHLPARDEDEIEAGDATEAELIWRTHLENVRQSTSRGMGETVLDLLG